MGPVSADKSGLASPYEIGSTGNFRDGGCVFDRQPLYVTLGAYAGSERITGIGGHIQNAAALHAVLIAHGTSGKNVVL